MIEHLAEILSGLHERWMPHPKQVEIGHALFYEKCKNLFICAGRNFGKTEISAYCTWRYAMQNPGSQNYIFEPFAKQAREILWASNRIQSFGPEEWIEDKNNTEMRITFKNGSFIKLEGSDNVAAIAGIKPKGLIVYDEFKDHRLESINNFEPNRAAFDVPALFIGTPPIVRNHFVDYAELAETSEDWKYFHAPTSSNPHIKADWLARKKRDMERLGELEEYIRSYEAIFVKGGKASIYPWVLTAPKNPLSSILPSDLHKWSLIVCFDPAASSCFAVQFSLFNYYTKKMIVIDEIYQTEHARMTSRAIWAQVDEKLGKWKSKVKEIEYTCDSAAAYFISETNEINPDVFIYPTEKHKYGIEGYISITRSIMGLGLLSVAAECENWWKEHENYVKDEKGRPPKKDDHLVNCTQYSIAFVGFNLDNINEPKPKIDETRYRTIEQDFKFNPYSEID